MDTINAAAVEAFVPVSINRTPADIDPGRLTREPPSPSDRSVPNPYGKKGGPEHQAKVEEVAKDVASRGLQVQQEFKVSTPNGRKDSRFVDVVGIDPKSGKVAEMHQIGKQTKKGLPVSRERRAIEDIEKATGKKPTFHPYNKIKPPGDKEPK